MLIQGSVGERFWHRKKILDPAILFLTKKLVKLAYLLISKSIFLDSWMLLSRMVFLIPLDFLAKKLPDSKEGILSFAP